jgi:DNA primase
MPGRIPKHFIDDLIARTDLVELIGSRVPLKKAGREWKACCPFHGEKTPSFCVIPDKQFYHCFGCGTHGTALDFLMNYDRLAFPEAVEDLAGRLGIEVPREGGDPGPREDHAEIHDLLARTARFYAEVLGRDARAQGYVAKRGLTPETVEGFLIGFAPNSWNEVLRRFGGSDAKLQALAAAGLVIAREGSEGRDGEHHYDRFRDRLMFPIRDARGRTLAFGGRLIEPGEPKYLNSPETAVFHKGNELYGLYEVRQSRLPLKRLLVVEGYMDVVRLHQAGIRYAVATLGTATTPEHLKRVFRLVSEVVFAFDGDRAGRGAAWRALQNCLPEAREGREIRFLFLPEGEDPDSLVGAEGREAFERRLDSALPLSEYLVSVLGAEVDLRHADGRAHFAELARPLFARVPEGVYRELLLGRLAEMIRLPVETLRESWRRGLPPAVVVGTAGGVQQVQGPTRERPRERAAPSRGAAASAGRGGLVRQAVHLLLHQPALATGLDAETLAGLEPLHAPGVDFLRRLLEDLRQNPARSTAQVLERWRDRPEGERLARLASAEVLVADSAGAARELRQALDRLRGEGVRQRIDELIEKGRIAELAPEEKSELQRLMSSRSADGRAGPRDRPPAS